MKSIFLLLILISLITKCNHPNTGFSSRKKIVTDVLNEIKNNTKREKLKERNFNYMNNQDDIEFENEYNLSKLFLNQYGIPSQPEFIDDSITMLDAHIIKVPIFTRSSDKDTLKSISFEFVFLNSINNYDFQFWSLIQEIGNDSIRDKLRNEIQNSKDPEYNDDTTK